MRYGAGVGEQKQSSQTEPMRTNTTGVFRPVKAKSRLPLRRGIIFSIIICVLVGGGLVAYLWWQDNGPDEETGIRSGICTDEAELTKAREATEGNYKLDDLLSLSSEIKKRDNYAEDANCVYIVLKAALASESAEDANSAFAQFEKFAKGEGEEPRIVAVDGRLVVNEMVALDEIRTELEGVKMRQSESVQEQDEGESIDSYIDGTYGTPEGEE